MNAEQIRIYLRSLSGGTLGEAARKALLERLEELEDDELDLIFPEREWAETMPAFVPESEQIEVYSSIMAQVRPRARVRRMTWLRAACALLFVVAGTLATLTWWRSLEASQQTVAVKTRWMQFSTGAGEHRLVTLSDQTRIWMNGATTLEVPETFDSRQRAVRLLEGEIFVEAGIDPSRPFRAEMDSVKVDVLGTSFNMRNYRNDPGASVSVATGKVAMRHKSISLILTPGKTGIWSKYDGILVPGKPSCKPGSWKQREFHFDGETLGEALDALEHAFGYRYYTKDKRLLMRPVKASFRDQRHGDILRVLGSMGRFRYRQQDSLIIITAISHLP